MVLRKERIAVAMSGGVDSSVAAGLLVEQGYDVVGVSLRLWEGMELGPRNCSDHRGAKEVAEFLGVPHRVLDLRARFRRRVVQPFADEYAGGRTPNPCIACNRDFKLGTLLEWADGEGIGRVATGHYARVARCSGRVSLLRGCDRNKDQSYFLFALARSHLERAVFPLGSMTKQDVRSRARDMGLAVAERVESQDICFGDHRALVESLVDSRDLGEGEIVDATGQVLGRHQGIHRYTVGQRKGLGLSAPVPFYVCKIDAPGNRLVVGPREELGCRGFTASFLHWIGDRAQGGAELEVQIRYRSQSVPCVVKSVRETSVRVEFAAECPAVTPGQAAVFYRGDEVLGGGWIDGAWG